MMGVFIIFFFRKNEMYRGLFFCCGMFFNLWICRGWNDLFS